MGGNSVAVGRYIGTDIHVFHLPIYIHRRDVYGLKNASNKNVKPLFSNGIK